MSIIGFFAGREQTQTETGFWQWFRFNEGVLFEAEPDHGIYLTLGAELCKINPNFAFEIGPRNSDRRELVFSAGGIREVFPIVESLLAAAPDLPRWKFVKFRQRREPLDLEFDGLFISADSVSVSLQLDGPKIGLTVFIPGYTKKAHDAYLSIAFLFLDHALGEYDVETRVGAVEVHSPCVPAPATTYTLGQLPAAFDSFLPTL